MPVVTAVMAHAEEEVVMDQTPLAIPMDKMAKLAAPVAMADAEPQALLAVEAVVYKYK